MMSSEKFNVTEHAVPGCHIREYPGSTVHQEDILKLHVKQYTPKNQAEPVPADAITIIAAHGAALPKVTRSYWLLFSGAHSSNYTYWEM